jgi:uncharacterized protein
MADLIIKNTYRTLMTRGMKGCYVYFTDKAGERFFRSRLMRSRRAESLAKVAEPDVPYNIHPSPTDP